jgi:Ca2+-binding EF-hand superfamily protein
LCFNVIIKLKEEEEEEEEEVVTEESKKKKYSRDGENPQPWPLLILSSQKLNFKSSNGETSIAEWEKSFYPASKFSVKNYTFTQPISLEFPSYMYMSKNYYEPGWFKTHRRLKNIIVVMEFAPARSVLVDAAEDGKKFSHNQEKNLRKAFAIADIGKSGSISVAEIREVLVACDVDVDGEEGQKFLSGLQYRDGKVTFDQLKDLLMKKLYYRVQSGRYYVALSLAEAGCLRAAIHAQVHVPFFPGKDTIVALRTGQTLIDATYGYDPPGAYQHSTATVCYRFIDSALNYSPQDLTYLLRALQDNECEKRKEYFVEVKSNRRRKQIDPSSTSLSKVFTNSDEHHILQYRIAAGRVTAMLKSRGMYPRDAFAVIDTNRDGLLNLTDLNRGFEWLGLKMDPSLVNEFMAALDKDRDGYINLDEFKAAVNWDDGGEPLGNIGAFNNVPVMPQLEAGQSLKNVQVPEAVLASIKIKVKKVTKFEKVWNSQGSMSREKGSVWEPSLPYAALRQNKVTVSLGHYAGEQYDNPIRDNVDRLALEVTDTSGNWVAGSSWLPLVLDKLLPHPARFRLAWSLTHGSNPFYAWEPVPPSEEFVALGMVGTKKDEEPDVKCMRCVPLSWTCPSRRQKRIWSYNGTGGRHGSIWVINTMNLIQFVGGHEPPRVALDLKSQRFFVKEYSDIGLGKR